MKDGWSKCTGPSRLLAHVAPLADLITSGTRQPYNTTNPSPDSQASIKIWELDANSGFGLNPATTTKRHKKQQQTNLSKPRKAVLTGAFKNSNSRPPPVESHPSYSHIYQHNVNIRAAEPASCNMDMTLEAMIAILALVTGLPSAILIMWKCITRHRRSLRRARRRQQQQQQQQQGRERIHPFDPSQTF